ncbi:hypothetical protein NDU88_001500 [Pleurodeles waltl]|uniref:Uncharacterized protein n=1 Tax=Pleurodeles waltl TaxID=8319 RepID=A0AAV7S879_PLEWA|nr:hypothetical protein NDU88_001500 [Pleurodeles waltl]
MNLITRAQPQLQHSCLPLEPQQRLTETLAMKNILTDETALQVLIRLIWGVEAGDVRLSPEDETRIPPSSGITAFHPSDQREGGAVVMDTVTLTQGHGYRQVAFAIYFEVPKL